VGAILGAPFMLSTLAFFVTATSAWIYQRRRRTGWRLRVNRQVMSRDLGFFLPLYAAAVSSSFLPDPHMGRPLVALGLLAVYAYYVYLNFRESAEGAKDEPLVFDMIWAWLPLLWPRRDREAHLARRESINGAQPRLRAVGVQVLVALALIMGGAYKFVSATQEVCSAIGFSPLIFSLIVAPVATELPEKFNSVIWIRESRDTLSLGNITGAMVFQATFPVTVGILLTPWHFAATPTGDAALLSVGIALLSAAVVLVTVRLGRSETLSPWSLAAGLLGWLLFVGYVAATRF